MENKDDYLDCLKAEIGRQQGCPGYYIRTEIVHEEIEGNAVWRGEVEVFGLIGHPKAHRCFAWGHARDQSDPNGGVIIALEALPIVSAHNAVRVQLIKDLRSASSQLQPEPHRSERTKEQ